MKSCRAACAGGGGSDVDIDFSFNCCRMTAYDDTLGTSASLSYDDFARLTSHTDNLGNTLGYEYDGMNRVTKVTDHTGKDTTYAYDKAGRVATIAYDPSGANRQTSYTYDGNSNVSQTTYSNSYWSDFTYDSGNRVTQHKLKKLTGPPPPVTHSRGGLYALPHIKVDGGKPRPYNLGGLPTDPRSQAASISASNGSIMHRAPPPG